MADKAWKATERAVALQLGGKRKPINGRKGADIEHARLCPEVKHRKSVPAWLTDALRQALDAATPGQLAIAVIHRHGARHSENLVVMRQADFVTMLATTERGDQPQ